MTTKNRTRYHMIKVLGKGGFARVVLARDLLLQRDVAIKQALLSDEESKAQFRMECEVMTRIRHPMIPQVYDVDAQSIIMEYIEGIRLDTWMERHGAMPMSMLKEVGLSLAGFLQTLHESPGELLYLDLKPENIIWQEGGKIRVIDYGTVRYSSRYQSADPRRIGSYGYASPEQWAGDAVDARADIYTLCVLLYDLACGKVCAGSPQIRFHQRRDSELPGALFAILHKGASPRKEERYGSMREFCREFEDCFQKSHRRYHRKKESYLCLNSVLLHDAGAHGRGFGRCATLKTEGK
ncbi:MAG: serine/threonine protein kinase [Lachnospiraceae bacterium]|nr:serine/threonine protein kinase [Lachnospiraceae bacterium]